jgi:hypothetical protein
VPVRACVVVLGDLGRLRFFRLLDLDGRFSRYVNL